MKYRILNMAETSCCPEVLAPLQEIAEIETFSPDQDTLAENIKNFNAYIATLKAVADQNILANAKKLKVIATPSTGLDHIDIQFCKKNNISVLSLKEETTFLDSITATAELTWGLVLATSRKIPWAHQAACDGFWARDRFRGNQLSGKTFGILGLGRLGKIVAQYAHAFRMNVIAHDTAAVNNPDYVTMTDFDTLVKKSDVLSIHIHLTDENRNLINENTFSKMKSSAILINTSRGAIINEPAMLAALKNNQIAAAGVDVINGEWDKNLKQHPLIKYAASNENLVITPHVGGVTFESQKMTLEFIIDKLKSFLTDIKND